MSYVAGTGLFTNSININIDQIEVNKNDITALNTNLGNFIIDTGNNFQDSSNYVKITSNILDDKIEDTSNYVLSTSNILDDKIEVLTNVLNGYQDENGYNVGVIDVLNGYTDLDGNEVKGNTERITNLEPIVLENTNNIAGINNVINGSIDRDENGSAYLDEEGNISYTAGIIDLIQGYYTKTTDENGDIVNNEQNLVDGLYQDIQSLRDKDQQQDIQGYVVLGAQAAFEGYKWAVAKAKNGGWFGSKLNAYQELGESQFNTFAGNSAEEIIGELNNMVSVYRYDAINNEAGIHTDPITGYKLLVGGKTKIEGNLEILETGTTYLNVKDYLKIKGVKADDVLKIDTTNKLLELSYLNSHFTKDANNNLKLKIHQTSAIKVDADGLQVDVDAYHFDKANGQIKLRLKTNSGIKESGFDGFEVHLKQNGGISKDEHGLYLKNLIDTFDNQSLEKDTSSNLFVKLKQSGGITKDNEGLKLNYQIDAIDTNTLSKGTDNKLSVKDDVFHPKITQINNTTSTIQENSKLEFNTEKSILTFTEGYKIKTYRDEAKVYAGLDSTNSDTNKGAKQYSNDSQSYATDSQKHAGLHSSNDNSNKGAKQYSVDSETHATNSQKYAGLHATNGPANKGAKQYATDAGTSASTSTTAAGNALRSEGSAWTAASVATGSAGVSALVSIGNALFDNGGEVQVSAVPIVAPLQIQTNPITDEGAIGLNINQYELKSNDWDLSLHEYYSSLIDWKPPSNEETGLKVNLKGKTGEGIVDFLNNVSSTLDGGEQFNDDLIGTIPDTFESIFKFDDTVGGTNGVANGEQFKRRIHYQTAGIFDSNPTQLSVGFYTAITNFQLNRNNYYLPEGGGGHEILFSTCNTGAQSYNDDGDNGIVIKFQTGRSGPMRIRCDIRWTDDNGNDRFDIIDDEWYYYLGNDNYSSSTHLELDDEFVKDQYHHYFFSFIIDTPQIRIVFYLNHQKYAVGLKNISDGNHFRNTEYHIIGGYNIAHSGIARTPLSGQFWSGNAADIKIYNNYIEADTLASISDAYINGDAPNKPKIFADRIKFNTNHFNVNSDFALEINDSFTGYQLEVATTSTLGGVKQGDNITIDGNGRLSATLVKPNWDAVVGSDDEILNKPTIPTLVKPNWDAVGGSDAEILNKPTIPTLVKPDWDAVVGSDDEILNKPTIPTLVKPDWDAVVGSDAEILNKPTIPTLVKSNWDATTGDAEILNKPFTSLDPNTLEVNSGVLSVIGGVGGNIQADWNAVVGSDSEILNKPFQYINFNTLQVNNDTLSAIDTSKWNYSVGSTTPDIYYNEGNVGIGTNYPDYLLEVNGDVKGNVILARNQNPYISIQNTDSSDNILQRVDKSFSVFNTKDYIIDVKNSTNAPNNGFQVKTNDTTRLKINQNGNIGIGNYETSSPSYLLEVAGDVNLFGSNSKYRINGQNLNYTHLEGTPPSGSGNYEDLTVSNKTRTITTTTTTNIQEPTYTSSSYITKTTIDSEYKYIKFENDGNNQTSYSITFPENTQCDILLVGGGGGGGYDRGGGAGAGACMVYKYYTMNGTYYVKVGKGGVGQTSTTQIDGYHAGQNGFNTEIQYSNSQPALIVQGGGGGAQHINNGRNGGCGGGAGSQSSTHTGGTATNNYVLGTNIAGTPSGNSLTNLVVYGSSGGSTFVNYTGPLDNLDGSGGGGIGENGQDKTASLGNDGGKGGDGRYNFTVNGVTNTFNEYFGITGHIVGGNHYIGGGGGGADMRGGIAGIGGGGGGGTGGESFQTGYNAFAYGGGGGGGGGDANAGGAGYSGVVVIRYKYTKPSTTTTTETYKPTGLLGHYYNDMNSGGYNWFINDDGISDSLTFLPQLYNLFASFQRAFVNYQYRYTINNQTTAWLNIQSYSSDTNYNNLFKLHIPLDASSVEIRIKNTSFHLTEKMNILPYGDFAGNYFVDKIFKVSYFDGTTNLYNHQVDYTGLETETLSLNMGYFPNETDRIIRLSFENDATYNIHNVCWFILKRTNESLY